MNNETTDTRRTDQDIYEAVIAANKDRMPKPMNHQTTSDTPETDKFRDIRENHIHRATEGDIWQLCESLERERDAAKFDAVDESRWAMSYKTERDELRAHLAKCHEAIGESPDSDTSELWKYFENFKSTIDRLRVIEQTAENIRTAQGLLPGGGRV